MAQGRTNFTILDPYKKLELADNRACPNEPKIKSKKIIRYMGNKIDNKKTVLDSEFGLGSPEH